MMVHVAVTFGSNYPEFTVTSNLYSNVFYFSWECFANLHLTDYG